MVGVDGNKNELVVGIVGKLNMRLAYEWMD